MENNENYNNNPDYSLDYSEINPVDSNEQNTEHQREAICKRCGVIWHPRNTDTRRPKRCPYCQSHRTEWVDQHPELLEGKDESRQSEDNNAEVENQDEEGINPDYSSEESMDYSDLIQDDTEDDTDEIDEEASEADNKMDYTRITPGINPDSSRDYSTQKTQAAGIPKAAVYLLLGAVLIYGVIRIWKTLRKPASRKATSVSMPQTVPIERPYSGLTDMGSQPRHLF